jgi:hypothetical protein
MDPDHLHSGWLSLGELYLRWSNTALARTCFERGLTLQRTKQGLRQYAQLLRVAPCTDVAERQRNATQSLALSKEALALDLSDGVVLTTPLPPSQDLP